MDKDNGSTSLPRRRPGEALPEDISPAPANPIIPLETADETDQRLRTGLEGLVRRETGADDDDEPHIAELARLMHGRPPGYGPRARQLAQHLDRPMSSAYVGALVTYANALTVDLPPAIRVSVLYAARDMALAAATHSQDATLAVEIAIERAKILANRGNDKLSLVQAREELDELATRVNELQHENVPGLLEQIASARHGLH